MKRLILVTLMSCGLTGAQAQLFSPEALSGAFLGTMIGGIAGGDCHHGFSGEGAAIGAGVGLLAGAVVGEAQRQSYYASQPAYFYPATTYAQPGYGYVYAPPYAYTPVYAPAPPRPNYAVGGTLLGALAGGLIGVGTDHGWEGAGIGAASGLVLGSVAEVAAQKRERDWAAAQATPSSAPVIATVAPPAQAPPPPARPAPQVYQPATPPAPVHQIPDAPRVPDAPTF